jgi:hypothetical protein
MKEEPLSLSGRKGAGYMKKTGDYASRIQGLMDELRTKTLTQAEQDRNITKLDYNTESPELRKLERMIAAKGEK